MNKFLASLLIAVLATASVNALAGSHGGAMSDHDKEKMTKECEKMDHDKADEKMKATCAKLKKHK